MAKAGRPRGKNNKEYVYSIRMDKSTKNRLEAYCKKFQMTKSEAIRESIEELSKGKEIDKE